MVKQCTVVYGYNTYVLESVAAARRKARALIAENPKARASLYVDNKLIEIIGIDLRASEIPIESLLRGVPEEDWGLAWEAIESMKKRGLTFPGQGSIFSFIMTFIKVKKFNAEFHLRRIKNPHTGKVERSYLPTSLPVSSALVIYGTQADNVDDDDKVSGSLEMTANAKKVSDHYGMTEDEIRHDLGLKGIPAYFIERLLLGEKIVYSRLSQDEKKYYKIVKDLLLD
ncbi:MAG: hypothetical protein LBF68_04960 [Christensenellaceae bacterium]|jgi:hypothetical protein|nr:hypothetical protein [Christensenellaceae bacterium]